MNFSSIVRWLKPRAKSAPPKANHAYKPRFETLEDRIVPTWLINSATPDALARNLTGGIDRVSNVQYFGAYVAAATFYDTRNVTGIQSGIVLSTGKASGVAGPNNDSGFTTDNTTNNDP